MDNFNAEGSIASLTPTVAHLFATAKPALASEGPIESVLEMHKRVVGGNPIERCLINLIVVYQQEYDDMLHKYDPFSNLCIQAVTNHVGDFIKIAGTALNVWSGYNNAIIFAPDHGAHIDSASGHGDHGVDIPQDMQLFHWYGINSAHAKFG